MSSQNNLPRIGVIAGNTLLFDGGAGMQLAPIDDAGAMLITDALETMRAFNVGQAWTFDRPQWLYAAAESEWTIEAPFDSAWMLRAKDATGRTFQICDVQESKRADQWQSFAKATDAPELARALALLTRAIGALPVAGPGPTGDYLLRTTRRQMLAASSPPNVALGEPGYKQHDCLWIAETQPEGRYLHAYDVSGMYLAVLGSLDCGLGGVRDWPAAAVARELPRLRKYPPGYWRVKAHPRVESEAPLTDGRFPIWVTTPMLELLVQRYGRAVELGEAFVWSERGRVFAPYYERIRAARAAGGLAADAAKEIYTRTIGRLASTDLNRRDGQLFRPDWRDTIVAQARANLHRTITRIFEQTGMLPAAVYVDAIYYGSESADPLPLVGNLHFEGCIELPIAGVWGQGARRQGTELKRLKAAFLAREAAA